MILHVGTEQKRLDCESLRFTENTFRDGTNVAPSINPYRFEGFMRGSQ